MVSYGFAVDAFSSSEEFFTAVPNSTQGCLILDIHMPGFNGWDTQQRLMKTGYDLPVIVISADEDDSFKEKALKAGAVGFLQKPFEDHYLLHMVNRVFHKKGRSMQKPSRKNSHKERIFSLPQNKIDFVYQKEHQDKNPKEQETSLKRIEVPPLLTTNKARASLKNLDGWQLTNDHKTIYREFIRHDFMDAIDMIDRIALIAEDEKHHPDIHLTQYRNLRVGLTTHDVGGLSEKDFIVALKINDLPISIKPMQKSRYSQKNIQPKQSKGVSLVTRKNGHKTKEIQVKRSFNRMDKPLKKA